MNHYKWPDPPGQSAFPIARPGYPFVFGAAFVTAVFAIIGLKALALLGLFATIFICYFFRDPDRPIPEGEGAVVSPADGKVIVVQPVAGNPFNNEPGLKISIFMSIFNVHVNRSPYQGQVSAIRYFPGKFFNASLDKASKDNEQNAVQLDIGQGRKLCFVQIAGLVARRIVCNVREGDQLSRGQRFGLICFGSRLDVYLPENTKAQVAVGDKVAAGTSILGYLP